MANIINQYGQVKLGVRSTITSPTDADAQAFITAAAITNPTQQSAINTLVTQLKTYGIWSKLKAVYPFVGGTAEQHRFNLKDPRTVNAAFYLDFIGGGTHSATGYQPNGTTAYADTKLIPSTTLTQYNSHLSYYSRSQTLSSSNIEFGAYVNDNQCMFLTLQRSGGNGGAVQYSISADSNIALLLGNTTTTGMYLSNRNSSTASSLKYIRNGVLLANATTTAGSLPNIPLFLGASNNASSAFYFSTKQCAFSSIGDGLTDTEAANFYTAVQTFQTTLGRHVGVPIVADTDAQAFIDAAIITDQTQATAITTLVTDLKAANIWSKMKAIYPFVGGTAEQHRFNLKDPRTVNAAFYLTFFGGGTHSANGYLPNGNSYADTKLGANLLTSSNHLSYYSRSTTVGIETEIGMYNNLPGALILQIRAGANYISGEVASAVNYTTTSSALGFWIASKRSDTDREVYLNNSSQATSILPDNNTLNSFNLFLGARNNGGTGGQLFSTKQSAFASIGDGLTDAETAAFYTAVQAYQTALGRNV
jgi:hypothetical protein